MTTNINPSVYDEIARLKRDNDLLRTKLEEACMEQDSLVEADDHLYQYTPASEDSYTLASMPTKPFPPREQPHSGDPNYEYDRTSIDTTASTFGSTRQSIARTITLLDSKPRPLSGNTSFQIRVESGLFGFLPRSMRLSDKRSPCAMFAVIDDRSQEVIWRFVKEFEQLRNFNSLMQQTLGPLIRASRVHLSHFPPKEFFTSTVPWQVDVRNDMLNAYFKSICSLNANPYFLSKRSTQSAVERAVSALWLHDVVDLSSPSVLSSFDDGEMWGYLLSKTGSPKAKKWECKYYVLNGAYLDVRENLTAESMRESIPLSGAFVQKKISFFSARDMEDERYVFQILENSDPDCKHTLTAENETYRELWLSRLRKRVQQIEEGKIKSDARFYSRGSFPRPFKLRESPHKSPYLPNDSGDYSYKSTIPVSNSSLSIASDNSSLEVLPRRASMGSHHRQSSAEENNRYSVYDNLYATGSSNNSGASIFDGGDFYMKISKPMNVQSNFDPSFYDNSNGHLHVSDQAATRSIPRSASQSIGSPISQGTYLTNGRQGGSISVLGGANGPEDLAAFRRSECGNMSVSASGSLTTKYSSSGQYMDRVAGKMFGIMPQNCEFLKILPSGASVPSIIARCIERLEEPGATSEIGIFRISGTQTLIDELQERFDTDGDSDLRKANIDVHTTADLLKRYLRSLPGSLLGEWPQEKAKAIMALPDDDQVKACRIEMRKLANTNLAVIKAVLSLLQMVSREETANSMGLRNLGVALSPALRIPAPILCVFIRYEQDIL